MARRFDYAAAEPIAPEPKERNVDHSTARAFAAALSALAISSLVVTTSANALYPDGTIAANSLQAGTISLSDDDFDQSLVDLGNMAPGRPEEQCITVIYDGTIVPVLLTLASSSTGDLAPFVDTTIERGTGASFGDCSGFEASGVVFEGRLDELDDQSPVSLGRVLNHDEATSFRFVFDLADDERAVGLASATDFTWVVVPE